MLRIGIVGLSVHSEAFTAIINSSSRDEYFTGSRVVALYEPPVNPDVAFTPDQLKKFRSTIQKHGVEEVSDMETLLESSDAIMVLSNDGRPHFAETLPALKQRKPVYIDKPLAENFEGVRSVFQASKDWNAPVFSCSALRYGGFQSRVRAGEIGAIMGGETYGPAPLQTAHVDLFWDGIHGVELLYAIMGTGCRSVQRLGRESEEVVVGEWEGNRMGVFRGIRRGRTGFGGRAYGMEGIATMEKFDGYGGLVREIVEFFRTGDPPVENAETIEIYAFMEAAKRSRILNGQKISVRDILDEECETCNQSNRR